MIKEIGVKVFIFIGKLSIVLFCMSTFLISSTAAQDVQQVKVLTYKEFAEKVLNHYPLLKKQNINVELAIAQQLRAVAGLLPRITGNAEYSMSNDSVYVFSTLLKQNAFTQDDFTLSRLNSPKTHQDYNFGIRAEMPLFNAFQTIGKIKAARLNLSAAEYDSKFTKMEALLIAVEAYAKALEVEQILVTVGQVRSESYNDIQQAEDLKNKGMILGADYFAAKVAFGGIKKLESDLANESIRMKMLLNILMGEDPLQQYALQKDCDEAFADTKELTLWLSDGFTLRADMQGLLKRIEAQKAEVAREKASILPRVNAYGTLDEDMSTLGTTGGESFSFGIKGKMDLLDPEYGARLKRERELLAQLECDKAILKDEIRKDVTGAYARFSACRENLPITHGMFDDAREAVKLTAPLYREGRKSIADLLDMRKMLIGSASDYYGLMSAGRISLARLYFLSGRLDVAALDRIITSEAR